VKGRIGQWANWCRGEGRRGKCFFNKKFSQLHIRLFDPFTATSRLSRLQIFHGYPTFETATFLENSRGHGYLGTLHSVERAGPLLPGLGEIYPPIPP
jgi:hypothetical protein